MKKEEVKQLLKELGVSEDVANMPAVVEPIYLYYIDSPLNYVREHNRVIIKEDGNISFINTSINKLDNGGVEIIDGDTVTRTNEYGVEVSKNMEHFSGSYTKIRRADGKVYFEFGNTKRGDKREIVALDNGDWELEGNARFLLSNKSNHNVGEEISPSPIDVDAYFADFEYNVGANIQDYPNLSDYYEELKKKIVKSFIKDSKTLEEERERNGKLGEEVIRLQNEIVKSEDEKKELLDSLERTTDMFAEALSFMAKVKKHPIGKMFFSREVKIIENKSTTLAPGVKNVPEERE